MNIIGRTHVFISTHRLSIVKNMTAEGGQKMIDLLKKFLSLLNVKHYLHSYWTDCGSLSSFCLVWKIGAPFICAALCPTIMKWLTNVHLINRSQVNGPDGELLRLVERLSRKAGLAEPPEVGIVPCSTLNIFVNGLTKKHALIFVHQGIVDEMSADELEGTIGHEISHIANRDTMILTLIECVVNAFVMFLPRALTFFFTSTRIEGFGSAYLLSCLFQLNPILVPIIAFIFTFIGGFGSSYFSPFLLELPFSILGWMVTSYFSRIREYRADRSGASLVGKAKILSMIKKMQQYDKSIGSFLQRQKKSYDYAPVSSQSKYDKWRASLFFSLLSLFSLLDSHPSTSSRMEKIEELP